MMKRLFILVALLALGGCATSYVYDGKAYATKEELFSAVDSKLADALSQVEPLPSPLTEKSLIFALPARDVMISQTLAHATSVQGSQPAGIQREMLENVVRSNYKNNVVYYDAIKKRNIYSSVEFVDLQSMSSELEPSENTDVMYYVEPTVGSGQYFYASFGSGKQIFAADRSSPSVAGKVLAFVDAVQLLAIRN